MKVTKMLTLVAAFGVLLLATGRGYSAPITYTGIDLEPYTTTNRIAAANAFDTAAALLGPVNIITFEGLTAGPAPTNTPFTVASGVNLTYGGVYWSEVPPGTGYYSGVNNLLVNDAWGFNTTLGGSNYLGMYAQPTGTEHTVSITFSFAEPINAFGAYFSGLEWFAIPSPITLSYTTAEGTHHLEIVKPTEADDELGLRFFGIADIYGTSQITLTEVIPGGGANYDAWGLDDVRYASSSVATVPEPSSMLLLGSGLLGLAGYARKRRSRT